MNERKRKLGNRKLSASRTKFNKYDNICKEEEKLSKLIFGNVENILTGELQISECNDTHSNEKSAWNDEDDEEITVDTALKAQRRSFSTYGGVSEKSNKYVSLLKNRYTSIVGTPKWAKLQNKECNDESDEEILQSCGFLSTAPVHTLPNDRLEFKKLKDLNCETYSEGPFINSVEFHSNATVALVAGSSGTFSLFAVDGKRNNKLHSVRLEKFPIRCAKFNFYNNCNEIILGTAKYPWMYVYDLEKAMPQKIALPPGMTNMQRFLVSPTGKYIAAQGRFGQVFLLDSKSKELICTLKQNSKLRALSFSPDDTELYSHSETGLVSTWNLNTQNIVNQWFDEGCIHGSSLDVSACGKFIATGSFEGVVNIYERESLITQNPKPKKTILNLTTVISSLKYNSTSEIVAFSSMERDGALKLLHLPSQTVFSNFPGTSKEFGKIYSIAFSPSSGYFAVGNNKSKVLLYRLKHYNQY